MDSGDDIIILDVRTQAEYDESHIPGAILIPTETIGNGKPEQLPDTDKGITGVLQERQPQVNSPGGEKAGGGRIYADL